MSADQDIKFIQISDSHLLQDNRQRLIGVDTGASLRAVIDLVSNEENVSGILASGDLSQDGSLQSYQRFSEITQTTGVPVYWIPGNHDDSKYFHDPDGFPLKKRDLIEVGNWRVLLLDSVIPGKESGLLADSELEYIENNVINDGKHHLLVMHHQPISCGSAWLDSMILENADDFIRLISSKDNIRAVLYGHIHQASRQQLAGISFFSTPSTCFQFKPRTDEFTLDTRLPGYRKIILKNDGSIETDVIRIKNYHLELDPMVSGY